MAMPTTTIRTAPSLDSFTDLELHLSQTPSTFYNAKPVLYYHISDARALIDTEEASELPIFAQESASDHNVSQKTQEVELFVSSESLTLFNKSLSLGISISYPSIVLHAIQRLTDPIKNVETHGLYMQLDLQTQQASQDDDEPTSIDLTLLPSISPEVTDQPWPGRVLLSSSADTSSPSSTQITELYTAVTACADLHPDPGADSDDEMGEDRIMFEGNVGYEGISGLPGAFQGVADGSLPPPFPGSGGWITAENVHEHFDTDGNFLGGSDAQDVQVLGEGAGRVRDRDEVERDEEQTNGHATDDDGKRTRLG